MKFMKTYLFTWNTSYENCIVIKILIQNVILLSHKTLILDEFLLKVFEDKHSDEESNDENEYEGDGADDENLPPLVVADKLLTPLHLVGSQLPHHICSRPL